MSLQFGYMLLCSLLLKFTANNSLSAHDLQLQHKFVCPLFPTGTLTYIYKEHADILD